MTSSRLARWGGIAAMLAGVGFIVEALLSPTSPTGSGSTGILETIHYVTLVLLAVGMVGFHALQKDHYGRIGRAGFYTVVIVAFVQVVVRIVILLSASEALLSGFEVLYLVEPLGVLVGLVLYGVATLQARVLSLWVGVAFIVALPIRLALLPIEPWGFVLFGLLWVALGYTLWSRREAAAEQPASVS